MNSSWLNNEVSLYSGISDVTGVPATLGQIILTKFGSDLPAICKMRQLDINDEDYKCKKSSLKEKLHLYAPSALLQSRKTGNVVEVSRTGILQLDFDDSGITGYDIEELKQSVFTLPFVAFCGLSCSGTGFYVLVSIAEPLKLKEYAEHCFDVFTKKGIKPDTSKGRNVQDLRFLSYDSNMLIREQPEPLLVKNFAKKVDHKYHQQRAPRLINNFGPVVMKLLMEINNVQVGQRWPTIQKVAYTIGGFGDANLLDQIHDLIRNTGAFFGQEEKYCKEANDCFSEGMKKPFAT